MALQHEMTHITETLATAIDGHNFLLIAQVHNKKTHDRNWLESKSPKVILLVNNKTHWINETESIMSYYLHLGLPQSEGQIPYTR